MKIILFANTDWYLYNYRLPFALSLHKQGHQVTLLSPPGEYSSRMERAGLRWLPFLLDRKGTNPLYELITIVRLFRLFRDEKPDLVHNFTIKPVLYGSIATRLTGVHRVVNAITGLGYAFSPEGSWLKVVVLFLYRVSLRGTQVIFQNPDDLNLFVNSRLISAGQAHIVPGSGVDMQIFLPSPEPDGEPVVMLTGRFLRSKGIPEFVEAARRLKDEGIRARFVLVGGLYPDNPESIREAELTNWQKEGWVEYWGWHDDMHQILPRASIVCLPTTYNEGLPRTLVEAGACGRPVITTDVPGCRLVVRNMENGLLIPPHNMEALVDALRTLLADRSLRERLGSRGREIACQEFSTESIIRQTMLVYEAT